MVTSELRFEFFSPKKWNNRFTDSTEHNMTCAETQWKFVFLCPFGFADHETPPVVWIVRKSSCFGDAFDPFCCSRFQMIPESVADTFAAVKELRLADNPFHCNCKLKWLKDYYETAVDRWVLLMVCDSSTMWENLQCPYRLLQKRKHLTDCIERIKQWRSSNVQSLQCPQR